MCEQDPNIDAGNNPLDSYEQQQAERYDEFSDDRDIGVNAGRMLWNILYFAKRGECTRPPSRVGEIMGSLGLRWFDK